MKRRGISLLEVMVASFVMSIVVYGAYQIFREGAQYFRTNQRAVDAQNSALIFLNKMTLEAVSAREDLIESYAAPYPGLVFASPVGQDGKIHYGADSRIIWKRFICYYYDATERKVYRKEEAVPGSTLLPGGGGSVNGDSSPTTVASAMGSRDTNYFASTAGLDARIVASDVESLTISDYDPTAGILPGTSTATTAKRAFDVALEVGNPNDTGPTGYYLLLRSRVGARG
ncbi:MAG: PilW family protein [Vulcanimicrobiota bacterium]